MNELKKLITIQTSDMEEMCEVRDKIYRQLAGNPDYIDNRIVLNGSDDRRDGTENTVCVYIFKDCECIPEITI